MPVLLGLDRDKNCQGQNQRHEDHRYNASPNVFVKIDLGARGEMRRSTHPGQDSGSGKSLP